jgi:hypothetical protein
MTSGINPIGVRGGKLKIGFGTPAQENFLSDAATRKSRSLSSCIRGGLPTKASTSGLGLLSSFIMVPQPVIMMTGVKGDSALMVRAS